MAPKLHVFPRSGPTLHLDKDAPPGPWVEQASQQGTFEAQLLCVCLIHGGNCSTNDHCVSWPVLDHFFLFIFMIHGENWPERCKLCSQFEPQIGCLVLSAWILTCGYVIPTYTCYLHFHAQKGLHRSAQSTWTAIYRLQVHDPARQKMPTKLLIGIWQAFARIFPAMIGIFTLLIGIWQALIGICLQQDTCC